MHTKEDDTDYKFKTTSRIGKNMGTDLAYGILCDPISSWKK